MTQLKNGYCYVVELDNKTYVGATLVSKLDSEFAIVESSEQYLKVPISSILCDELGDDDYDDYDDEPIQNNNHNYNEDRTFISCAFLIIVLTLGLGIWNTIVTRKLNDINTKLEKLEKNNNSTTVYLTPFDA